MRGLYYAGGSSVPGVGLPMCLISAENVLKRVRGDRTAGPLPEPPIDATLTATPDSGSTLEFEEHHG